MTIEKFEDGDRVILEADIEEGIPEETGTVEGGEQEEHPEMYVVRVDTPLDVMDDCLREVHASLMRRQP